jgi:hypothetical protein
LTLWTPRSHIEGRKQHAADLLNHVELKGKLDYWNRELKRIDPYLELVKANDNASMPGLKPGYFHVLRHNPGAPPSVIVHEGPNGEFREPDSGLFEELKRKDMWRDEPAWKKARAEREADAESKRDEYERKEELRERIDHALTTTVSFPKVLS